MESRLLQIYPRCSSRMVRGDGCNRAMARLPCVCAASPQPSWLWLTWLVEAAFSKPAISTRQAANKDLRPWGVDQKDQ
eukprot:2994663-Amphidinium_carterae.1